MIPVSTLYDDYIERRKFTEQKKKNPVEYIVPPPSRGSEQKAFSRAAQARTTNANIVLFRTKVERKVYFHSSNIFNYVQAK